MGVFYVKRHKTIAQSSGDKCNERIKKYQDRYTEISEATGVEQDKKRMTLTKGEDNDRIKATGYTKPKINIEDVYQQAKNQGRHAGTYKDSLNKSQARLRKSINSHQNQVDEHFDKLNNPEKYDIDWNNKTDEQKQGLLKKWQKDMIRNAEEAEIERRVFNERFRNE